MNLDQAEIASKRRVKFVSWKVGMWSISQTVFSRTANFNRDLLPGEHCKSLGEAIKSPQGSKKKRYTARQLACRPSTSEEEERGG